MGKSLAPEAPFDLVHCYARRRDGAVEIVYGGADVAAVEAYDEAVLRREGRKVRGSVTVDTGPRGPRVLVRVDRDQLSDGTWAVRLRGDDVQPLSTRTRLLVQGDRPLVLLWGGRDGDSRLPVPRADRQDEPGPDRPDEPVRGLLARLRPQRG